ncbi:MAG: DUF1496 domain-containing protein [Rhizobiales bacterium]|nr:DUF1496 domain-containing protein [Hyphomicrobiales bacterium]
MHRLISGPLFACALALPLTAAANAQQATSPQTCIYESRAYSEGADVCIARSLMQTCMSDAGRLIWKTVTDPAISRLCVGRGHSRWSGLRRRITRHTPPPAPSSAKCFHFNGKTYCE